ncbi:hypothetical protein GCM10020331_061470 [Ectobacillus funiculus]
MPVKELKGIRKKSISMEKNEKVMPGKKTFFPVLMVKTVEIAAEFELGSASEFGFKVRKISR